MRGFLGNKSFKLSLLNFFMISFKEVSKDFGNKKILNKFSININKGEVVGLIGPSGAGKSVFIKMLIGFFNPSKGIIKRDEKTKMGFSMQNNSLYDYLTVKQNLWYFSKIYGVDRKTSKKRIKTLINNLGLKDYEKKIVKDISGGTKKRVDIACSLINNPDVIVLDEPFAGLDPSLIENLLNFLKELNKKGKTIVVSSHRVREILSISSQIFLVNKKNIRNTTKSYVKNLYKKW